MDKAMSPQDFDRISLQAMAVLRDYTVGRWNIDA